MLGLLICQKHKAAEPRSSTEQEISKLTDYMLLYCRVTDNFSNYLTIILSM